MRTPPPILLLASFLLLNYVFIACGKQIDPERIRLMDWTGRDPSTPAQNLTNFLFRGNEVRYLLFFISSINFLTFLSARFDRIPFREEIGTRWGDLTVACFLIYSLLLLDVL